MVLAVAALGLVIDQRVLGVGAGLLLIAWAIYHQLRGARHRVRVGMRTGLTGLAVWSFLMASAHGAGLMLVPVLLPLGSHHGHARNGQRGARRDGLAAIAVHSLAMLLVTGVIAVVVYEWVGVGFLRRGWLNLDRLWTAALATTGALLILFAPTAH